MPWRSALWLYNISWLDQDWSKRFLKQLTVSAANIQRHLSRLEVGKWGRLLPENNTAIFCKCNIICIIITVITRSLASRHMLIGCRHFSKLGRIVLGSFVPDDLSSLDLGIYTE